MQYILYEVQPHSEWQLSLKERLSFFKLMPPILFRRFTHMKGRIACIQPWHVSSKKHYIHPRVLLQSNVFFVLMHAFGIECFTPLWRRLCAYLHPPCFKEYHSRLKLLLKGIHFVVSLSSFHEPRYLLKRTLRSCKSLGITIFLSKKCRAPLYSFAQL
jgi:hypothetical protein